MSPLVNPFSGQYTLSGLDKVSFFRLIVTSILALTARGYGDANPVRAGTRADPSRGYGRLLRLGRGRQGSDPQGQAPRRRRPGGAGGGDVRVLRGARLRGHFRHADDPCSSTLPPCHLHAKRLPRL